MTKDMLTTTLRRGSRVSAVPLGLALALVAAPAVAAPPTTWEPDDTSGLRLLTVIVLIPLAAIAVITLLTYLPSLVRGRSNEPAVAFQRRSEWFGGPRAGADAAVDQASGQGSESGKGGAGARW